MNEKRQVRYSDQELKEFKDLILGKLESARLDYEMIRKSLTLQDDNGTDDTSPTFKLIEDAADVSSKEEAAQNAVRLQKYIEHLQNALIRIENKTYGICRITGQLIAKERLRSVPHSTMSMDAKRSMPDA
jgi:RNA polymerase-binding transcription factor DksA